MYVVKLLIYPSAREYTRYGKSETKRKSKTKAAAASLRAHLRGARAPRRPPGKRIHTSVQTYSRWRVSIYIPGSINIRYEWGARKESRAWENRGQVARVVRGPWVTINSRDERYGSICCTYRAPRARPRSYTPRVEVYLYRGTTERETVCLVYRDEMPDERLTLGKRGKGYLYICSRGWSSDLKK